jgi:hypothetical protein
MRLRELTDWPPIKFEADAITEACPAKGDDLIIQAATFIPGSKPKTPGHVIVQLKDPKSGAKCSTRIRVTGLSIGRKVAEMLSRCLGLSLSQAGNTQIPEDKSTRNWKAK